MCINYKKENKYFRICKSLSSFRNEVCANYLSNEEDLTRCNFVSDIYKIITDVIILN